jgi:hypothetical protein
VTLTRIDPAIPLRTPRGKAFAHFVDDCGDEREAMWVCFGQDGQIWWWPNSQVRACPNFSLGRDRPEEYNMAKKAFKPGGSKGKLHRELGVKEGTKIPAKRLAKAARSKNPEVKRDAIRAETMKKWNHKGKK